MTRNSAKNKVNKILHNSSLGIFSDEYWSQVNKIWKDLDAAGFDVYVTSATYKHNEDGQPVSKEWHFKILLDIGKDLKPVKPLLGILTAHGAGTVEEPLSRYDISAYVF